VPDASPFWKFSLTVYADPAVQQECLRLQDDCGIDVNVLLFCAFAGAVHGAVLSDSDVREAVEHVHAWHNDVVRSVRHARRALKPFAAGPSPLAAAGALRKSIAAAELEAERVEQMMLESWCVARLAGWRRGERTEATAANIRTLLAVCGGSAELPDRVVAAALAAT
jgi:uncharacterized protein (TIGR02444 family)